MITPLRWMSDEWDGWYFERMETDSDTWIEYVKNKPLKNLTQYSMESDVNGYAVVVLRYDIYNTIAKLTEGMAYFGSNQTYNSKYMKWINANSGYWVKKNSKNIFILSFITIIFCLFNKFNHYFYILNNDTTKQ